MTHFQLAVILVTVSLSAFAQLLFKLGMDKLSKENIELTSSIYSIFQALISPFVLSGLIVYAVSVIAWLWVLSKVDLSIAYPFVGISFIFTLFIGILLLNESINSYKIAGTIMIAIGCFLVSKSS
ncbi:EamA family transporter [Eionea flava]